VTSKKSPSKVNSTLQRLTRSSATNNKGGPPKQYKTRSMARASPKLSQDLTKLVSIDEDEDDSDAVLPSPARRKRRGTEKAQYTKDVVDNVEEDSEDEIRPSLIKRRGHFTHSALEGAGNLDDQSKQESTPMKSSIQQEQEDLEEDLEDLQESSEPLILERIGHTGY